MHTMFGLEPSSLGPAEVVAFLDWCRRVHASER
jgi:hypothetical protein